MHELLLLLLMLCVYSYHLPPLPHTQGEEDNKSSSEAPSSRQSSSDSSDSKSAAAVKWEANRYRRGTMHAMADAILERMRHLRKREARRAARAKKRGVAVGEEEDVALRSVEDSGPEAAGKRLRA